MADSLGQTSQKCPFDPHGSPYEFINRYGLKTEEGRFFDWETHQYQVVPFQDTHPDQVHQWAAQTGKSVLLMTNLQRNSIQFWGSAFGYYFPDYFLPLTFSEQRFKPFVESNPSFSPYLGSRDGEKERSDNSKRIRTFGPSTIFFLSVLGKTSTEGLPLKGVFFDEVRRMAAGDIQRAEERLSHQVEPINIKASTPLYPDADINAYFRESDQRYYHSACRCPDGVVLAEVFPDCIGTLKNATPELETKIREAYARSGLDFDSLLQGEEEGKPIRYPPAFYLCPRCGEILPRPGVGGKWVARDPSKWAHGYHVSQMLSPIWPAGRILDAYEKAKDLQEFHNSKLGLSYIDKTAQLVLPEHLEACENTDLVWKTNGVNCAMGIDGMGGYCCIIVKERSPDGKHRTVHLEVAIGDDPWARCAEIMRQFDVSVCVADSKPNWNDAQRFAKAFSRRVWLADYVTTDVSPMVRWGDKEKLTESERKTEQEDRFDYTVQIHRTKGLEWSLGMWAAREKETPGRHGPVQQLPKRRDKVVFSTGMGGAPYMPVELCRDVYWDHLQRLAKKVEWIGGEAGRRQGKCRIVFENVGLDPHFAHADLYADVALIRVPKRQNKILFL